VFDSDRAGRRHLFMMRSDGSHVRQITHGSYEAADAVFFPNGRKIAFDRTVGRQGDIYTVHLDGSHQRRLTDNSKYDYYPDVSPDGTRIAFNRDLSKANPELFVMRSDGTHEKRLTHTSEGREFDATFSPDDRKIAFDSSPAEMSDYDIWVMNADGTDRHKILDGPSYDYVSDWARR
jgi:TolB protein